MAFDITNRATQTPGAFIASSVVEVADKTDSTGAQDMGAAAFRHFRAFVSFSAFTEGSAESSVVLEVSSSATFASDILTLDGTQVIPAAIEGLPNVYLSGQVPTLTGYRYARVVFTAGTGASGTFDTRLEAA